MLVWPKTKGISPQNMAKNMVPPLKYYQGGMPIVSSMLNGCSSLTNPEQIVSIGIDPQPYNYRMRPPFDSVQLR